jgi:WD40 repeat protein
VILGTVGYMSPEQVRGQAADARTDLFALGAILYEMLTGRRAFQKPTSPETMSAILNEEPPSITQIVRAIPPPVQRVVQRCLEKSPAQRFHSASDLAFALEALSDSDGAAVPGLPAVKPRAGLMWVVLAPAAAAVFLIGMWFTRASAIPVVESVVQLTNDGQPKAGLLETDGARIYFTKGPPGSFRIEQVSVHGGETGDIPTTLVNAQVAGLTADGATLLAAIGVHIPQGIYVAAWDTQASLWMLPLPVGHARKLGDIEVTDASLFPDGRILYAAGSAVFLAEKDASNPKKLEGISQYALAPMVSPDGKQLVFAATNANSQWAVYKAEANGTGVHQVLSKGPGLPTKVWLPRWTQDGKHVLFTGQDQGRWDLWVFSDRMPFFGRGPNPVRLTNGPISYGSFVGSRDGRQIFAIGAQRRGELVRYNLEAREFVPYLGGISAYDPTFSRDGKWVAYLSYPEHTVWRCRADGSDRLQLTYPPVAAQFPRVSPEGSRVAFSTDDGNVFVVSINGGTPQKLIDKAAAAPDWSPDGNELALTFPVPSTPSGGGYFEARIFDLRSGTLSTVPDSRDKIGPWFISQQALIATSENQSKLALFDFKTKKWTDLTSSPDKYVNWEVSPDLKYLLYQTGGNHPKIFRMRLTNRAVEEVASLNNFRGVSDPYQGTTQLGVAPDNSPLLTRDIGTEEIYAIMVGWP